ncbi:hypothetical protein V8G54_012603 [Vigna mungo]|uniref:Uncharacterized protein n=1 Tax=Vigna mungo TaxID=3915 RepID=A0AAQ3NUJ6_VIGMU
MNRHAVELIMASSHHHLAMSSPLAKLLPPPFEHTSQNPYSPPFSIFPFENEDHPTHSSLLSPFFHFVHHQYFKNIGHTYPCKHNTSKPSRQSLFECEASINKIPQHFILELLGR